MKPAKQKLVSIQPTIQLPFRMFWKGLEITGLFLADKLRLILHLFDILNLVIFFRSVVNKKLTKIYLFIKIVIFAKIFNSDEYNGKVDKTIFATAKRFYINN